MNDEYELALAEIRRAMQRDCRTDKPISLWEAVSWRSTTWTHHVPHSPAGSEPLSNPAGVFLGWA